MQLGVRSRVPLHGALLAVAAGCRHLVFSGPQPSDHVIETASR
jgi:hypothetical protein